MSKIGICGNFGGNTNAINGQTLKTKIFKEELADIVGDQNILTIDSYNWKEKPLKLFFDSIKLIKQCENLIIMPAHRGIKVFLPLFVLLNLIFNKNIHYIVIGGWLPNYLKMNKFLLHFIKKINSIHVETYSMVENLNKMGIKNVYYMPNFKRLNYLSEDELVYQNETPFKICTFSRVTREKGIEEAIEAVNKINKKSKKTVVSLDIYGPIDKSYEERFALILSNSLDHISYKGVIPHDKTVETIKNYFLLVFPTYYPGEGFAGTVLDSLASGVPILGSNWRYNSEIIKDGVVGMIYELTKKEELVKKLELALNNKEYIFNMKTNCIEEYKKYEPSNVINNFLKTIQESD